MATNTDRTPSPPPDAMREVIAEALCGGGEEQYTVHVTHPDVAQRIADAVRERLLPGMYVTRHDEDLIVWHERPDRPNADALDEQELAKGLAALLPDRTAERGPVVSEPFVWRAVELSEADACEFCGGHPEICGCDEMDEEG